MSNHVANSTSASPATATPPSAGGGAGGSRPEQITQSLPIPESKMGWIVGKKGSYISQLSRKSGASISISESTSKEYGMVWKYVQITGSGRAVDRAKKLLHLRLERLEPRSSSNGSGGSHGSEESLGEEDHKPSHEA